MKNFSKARQLIKIIAVAILFTPVALGNGSPQADTVNVPAKGPSDGQDKDKVVRVGGNYVVASVDKQGESSFLVQFKSVQPTGKYDVLRLESDHVHVAVKVGQTLRLSAEIMSTKGAVAEVSQVLLFLQGREGPVPVWLLSNKAGAGELKASRYLEMHAPINDFVVM